ncbi:YcxB family protein [Sutcliffiella horikoshii]|uniref:YcxB family protein n=1 Tax=Sutcliffiella horikoshii TaxID=79883 RepID=UPI001F281AE4|nr:YcxB family protein [Sutcliffiella horikoshii]MCG1021419.1 YcxB family protein [Sutcliffiella horikoshii]
MENNEIKVSGLISEDAMKEYMVFHSNKTRIWYVIISILLYSFLLRIAIPDVSIIFMLFANLFMGTIVWFMVSKKYSKKGIKEYRSDPLMQQEVFYTINAEGIYQIVGRSEMLTRWDDILSIHETKNLFLFYISKNKAIVIPQKFLLKNEMQRLRQLIKENGNSQGAALKHTEPITRKQPENPDGISFTIFISEKMFIAHIHFLARKAKVLFPIWVGVIYLLLALLLFKEITIFIASFAVIVIIATWFLLLTVINWKAAIEYRSDRRMHNDIHLEVSPDGITQTLESAQSHYSWNNILSIYETKTTLLFFVSKNKAILLPQAYLNADERSKIKSIISENAKTKKVAFLDKAS